MAETSGFWTTGAPGTGHQVASYTQAAWSTAGRIFSACNGYYGIAPGYENELAGTVTDVNYIAINTGGGVSDGKYYYNGASMAVNIPSPSAGHTRTDRIVLRADWAGIKVSVIRIAGVEDGVAPAITRTPGTTWDVMLYQAHITDAGVITLTDERDFASGGATSIATGAVTLAKMAANSVDSDQYVDGSIDLAHMSANSVDSSQIVAGAIDLAHMSANSVDSNQYVDGSIDTAHYAALSVDAAAIAPNSVNESKIGDSVMGLTKRQGGSATHWASVGTSNYTTTAVRLAAGSISSSAAGEVTVTFPTAFSYIPIIFINAIANPDEPHYVLLSSYDATGFAFSVRNAADARLALTCFWIAIGTE